AIVLDRRALTHLKFGLDGAVIVCGVFSQRSYRRRQRIASGGDRDSQLSGLPGRICLDCCLGFVVTRQRSGIWYVMPVIKKMLSTDMLPGDLDDRQRFLSFAELFEHFSNTGEFDPAEDVPFRAAMNSITIGTTLLGRCDGTFRTVRRSKRLIHVTNDDRYCLA